MPNVVLAFNALVDRTEELLTLVAAMVGRASKREPHYEHALGKQLSECAREIKDAMANDPDLVIDKPAVTRWLDRVAQLQQKAVTKGNSHE